MHCILSWRHPRFPFRTWLPLWPPVWACFSGRLSGDPTTPVDYFMARIVRTVRRIGLGWPYFSGTAIFYVTDNEANCSVVNKLTSASTTLMPLVRPLALLCTTYNIYLRAAHVPGVLNVYCDFLSRPEKHCFSPSHCQSTLDSPFLPTSSSSCSTFYWYSDQVRTKARTLVPASSPCAQFYHWLTPPPPTNDTQLINVSSSSSAPPMP